MKIDKYFHLYGKGKEILFEEVPSVEPQIKPITYHDCSNAMMMMWMDKIVTDGEYNKIMDRLNKFEIERRTDETVQDNS